VFFKPHTNVTSCQEKRAILVLEVVGISAASVPQQEAAAILSHTKAILC
jgi:hypothetical protein